MAERSTDIAKSMFQNVMMGEWDAVLREYEEKEESAQTTKITRSDDTVLHVAVSSGNKEGVEGRVELVKSLVNLVKKTEVLEMKNNKGNNPLHLTAALGIVEMCECIVERHDFLVQRHASLDSKPEDLIGARNNLIGARNNKGETPLFIAALRGNKKAFLYMHEKSPNKGVTLCRRNDGDTILHCSISGEYFDLAYQIAHLYEGLANNINQKGYSPLHLLATRPSAFKSGSRLGKVDQIFYSFVHTSGIHIDPLKHDSVLDNTRKEHTTERKSKFIPPDNYAVCFEFLGLVGKIMRIAINNVKKRFFLDCKLDSEASLEEGAGIKENQLFPPNYSIIRELVKLASMVVVIPLGLGMWRIERIKLQKQKHKWACQVMEKLIDLASEWEYDNTGKKPPREDAPMTMTIASDEAPADLRNLGTTYTQVDTHSGPSPNQQEDSDSKEAQLAKEGMETVYSNSRTNRNKSTKKRIPKTKQLEGGTKETAVLVAARMGVVEMVGKILETFPVAIQDTDQDNKNIILLAVENRQPYVYQYLLKKNIMRESVFQEVDNKGNSALHLAATLGNNRPWLIPGAALQMQWEIKWFKYVSLSMPRQFFPGFNLEGLTPMEVFTETHKGLLEEGGTWLTNTSQSCSVVAALIATVAFATSATVPGGVQDSGYPTLGNKLPFDIFAIFSLVALCFSVTALVMFLSILTSRYEEKDFFTDLPLKLIMGLSSLFVAIASMLVAFCAGHFFVLEEKLKYAAYPVYAFTCLPVTFFALAQFPLYVDLIRCTIAKVPQRTYKMLTF